MNRRDTWMAPTIEAVIFDMDGVLMDTVGYWVEAERSVFGGLGVEVTDELAAQTSSMSTSQVTDFWFAQHPWETPTKAEVEQQVIDRVFAAIQSSGRAMPGVAEFVRHCQSRDYVLGVATNSPRVLMHAVLNRIEYQDVFQAQFCVEDVFAPKPSPEIYQACLRELHVTPSRTLIVEDSLGGAQAGLAAGCRVALLGELPMGSITSERLMPFADFNALLGCMKGFTGEQ